MSYKQHRLNYAGFIPSRFGPNTTPKSFTAQTVHRQRDSL